jgi:hypothetical protein
MSLILTTNTSTNDGSTALNTGINRPYDYRNFLTDTFDIEANSEVAVQSVKFCKEGEISLNQRNCEFFIFQGDNNPKATDVNGNEVVNLAWVTSQPVLTRLNSQLNKNQLYTPKTMANQIQRAIRDGMNHPDVVLNSNTNVAKAGEHGGGVIVDVSRDSDQQFEGFQIDINYGRSASITANSRADMTFTDAFTSSAFAGDWDNTTFRVTKDAGLHCEMIDTNAPISQLNGSFKCDYTNAGGLWSMGLTRYLDVTVEYDDRLQPPSYASDKQESWYDWVAHTTLEYDGKYRLRLFHAIVDPDISSGDKVRLVEFEYWTYGPSKAHFTEPIETFATSAGYGTTAFQTVEWSIDNERVTCIVKDGGAGGKAVSRTLCDGSEAIKLDNMKPTSSTTKYLYPKVEVKDDTSYMEIIDMRHSKPVYPTFVYGQGRTTTDLQKQGNKLQNYDFYCKLKLGGVEDTWAGQIDTRYMFDYDDITSGPTENGSFVQLAMATNGTLNASETNGSGLGIVIIQQPNNVEAPGDNEYYGYMGQEASIGGLFGFPDEEILYIPNTQTSYIQSWTSWEVPDMVSSNSIFVRLNNFTQTTINGQTNGISKIIYHMPRFDNAGSEFGGLFFEPTQRTYIKLRNTNAIKCQEFNLSIVNSDETLATSITGKTIIMLHIRKST